MHSYPGLQQQQRNVKPLIKMTPASLLETSCQSASLTIFIKGNATQQGFKTHLQNSTWEYGATEICRESVPWWSCKTVALQWPHGLKPLPLPCGFQWVNESQSLSIDYTAHWPQMQWRPKMAGNSQRWHAHRTEQRKCAGITEFCQVTTGINSVCLATSDFLKC